MNRHAWKISHCEGQTSGAALAKQIVNCHWRSGRAQIVADLTNGYHRRRIRPAENQATQRISSCPVGADAAELATCVVQHCGNGDASSLHGVIFSGYISRSGENAERSCKNDPRAVLLQYNWPRVGAKVRRQYITVAAKARNET